MRIIRNTYTLKFILLIILMLSIVIALFSVPLYTTTRGILEAQLGENSKSVAKAVSLMITDNAKEYKELLASRDMNSDFYRKMQKYLIELANESDVKYIYTETRIDSKTIEFVLDSNPTGHPDYSPLGSIGPNDYIREEAYRNREAVYGKLVNHSIWGDVISAYVPLYDENEEFMGLVGVDVDGKLLISKLGRVFYIMLFTYLILIIIILFLLIRFSGAILEPVMKDKLTGVYNKRHFDKYITQEMKNSIKNSEPLSILMLDLDHFKNVNDTYGHGYGDKVLKSVAAVIRGLLRKSDYLARYGGEEFIIILPNTTVKSSMLIAERIRQAVANTSVYNDENNIETSITISIGAAEMTNKNQTAGELINNADKALYDAKIERNKVSMNAINNRTVSK